MTTTKETIDKILGSKSDDTRNIKTKSTMIIKSSVEFVSEHGDTLKVWFASGNHLDIAITMDQWKIAWNSADDHITINKANE